MECGIFRRQAFSRITRRTAYTALFLPALQPWIRFLAVVPCVAPESTVCTTQAPSTGSFGVSERFILKQLSDLLSIDARPSADVQAAKTIAVPLEEGSKGVNIFNGLLSPADRLRGVFLQKLRGKASVNATLSATGVTLTPEIFADVLNKGDLSGTAMVSFFYWAIKEPNLPKNIDTYHTVLKALGRRKFFSSMEEILILMKNEGIRPDSATVSILIDSYVRARRVYKAIELFERLEEFAVHRNSESFNVLIHSLCRRAHVRIADSLFRKMKGKFSFDKGTYNELIWGWARLGRVSSIERILEEMVVDEESPDSSTYAHLIEGLGRADRIHDAVDVFRKLEAEGCIPDTTVYNALICNFISAKNWEECMKYYKDMVSKRQLPDVDTYRNLITAFLKVRRVADALELFDEMLSRGICPSTGMVTSFIEPLCGYGPPHAAMLIYKKSKKAGCRISLKAYKLLLMRLSRFGKCGMVLKIWEEMQECGYSSDVEIYEYIVDGLCNIGQLDNAVLVVEESLKTGLCIGRIVYSKLNNKLLEANKVEIAYKLLLKVKETRVGANARRYWRANGWHV